jgi:hypothetical protein
VGQAGVEHDAIDGLAQGAVGTDDGLEPAGQQIERSVPVAQLRLVDVIGDGCRSCEGASLG